ncbi:MAG: NADH-quinone oxidoreductase subunit N [Planctomycetota bacterium]|nr:MAG: NADH-quinone oxidoreductase subunit N [Planctomycetota bacterium]
MSWFSWSDMWVLAPVAIVALGGAVALLIEALLPRAAGRTSLTFAGVGTLLLGGFATVLAWAEPGVQVHGSLVTGPFAVFLGLVVLGGTALSVLYAEGYDRAMGFDVGEYHGLKLLAAAGMLFLVAANDLVTLFIAFELMSLPVYALVAADRRRREASEGAMKYFVLGAFASAVLLYGFALLYGATGTIYLHAMPAAAGAPLLKLAALALVLVGAAFKVGAVPFHAWIPDAYQGAPASVTGFMAVAVKAAAFAVLVRLLLASGLLGKAGMDHMVVTNVLWVLALVTLIVGNVLALAQTNLKRLLAYSGIAHTGYALLGVVAAMARPEAGLAALLYYLAAYTAMTLGAFAVLVLLATRGRELGEIEELAGLGRERPLVALGMTVCLVSLLGVPPTAGFIGKLWLFQAALEAGFTGLVVVAALATIVSIYYYLYPVVVMYTGTARQPVETFAAARLVLALAAGATLLGGMFPGGLYDYALRGVQLLLGAA